MSIYLAVLLPIPIRRTFTYRLPDEQPIPKAGVRVRVPFGKSEKIGFIAQPVELQDSAQYKIKDIIEILDQEPLFEEECYEFLKSSAAYYHHPLGEVLISALPKALKQGKILAELTLPATQEEKNLIIKTTKPELSAEQDHAVQSILKEMDQAKTFLLHGATGTGKTEVYLQIIEQCLNSGKQALILIPEIALTPQTLERFEDRFPQQVAVYHSGLTEKKRLETWLNIKTGARPLLIGTRSSLLLPFKQLGLIIVDEEHDPAFKQQTGFRYSARDLAVYRGQYCQCPVVLGSATPSLESLLNAKKNRYQHLRLSKRHNLGGFPSVQILDVRHKKLIGGLAPPLIQKIHEHLATEKQVLIFLNRRGYAPTWMCFNCHWQATCQACQSRLTYHLIESYLRCPQCDQQQSIPKICPDCQHNELHPVGSGTQRIEETLENLFSAYPITRLDSDATRKKNQLAQKLNTILSGKPQLILGTQMLAKGHHFPNVTLAVILDADAGLFSSDFRGAERMGQLITQVSGRAGRSDAIGEVAIQTQHPDHPLLQMLVQTGYANFAEQLLLERAECKLPPYTHLALFSAEARDPEQAKTHLEMIRSYCQQSQLKTSNRCSLYGPLPAPILKRQNRYRFQLLIFSDARNDLQKLLTQVLPCVEKIKSSPQIRCSINIDPIDIL